MRGLGVGPENECSVLRRGTTVILTVCRWGNRARCCLGNLPSDLQPEGNGDRNMNLFVLLPSLDGGYLTLLLIL